MVAFDFAFLPENAGYVGGIDVMGTVVFHVPAPPLPLAGLAVHVAGDDGKDFFLLGTRIADGLLQIRVAPIALAGTEIASPDAVGRAAQSGRTIMAEEDNPAGRCRIHLLLEERCRVGHRLDIVGIL